MGLPASLFARSSCHWCKVAQFLFICNLMLIFGPTAHFFPFTVYCRVQTTLVKIAIKQSFSSHVAVHLCHPAMHLVDKKVRWSLRPVISSIHLVLRSLAVAWKDRKATTALHCSFPPLQQPCALAHIGGLSSGFTPLGNCSMCSWVC